MSNYAIITARGGSKGLKRKNVLSLAGKPLIGWTIEAAKRSASIDKVYVSTEDTEIASISKTFGAEVIPRPMSLAQDDSSSEDVLTHAIKFLGLEDKPSYNICLLQPTSPCRSNEHIDESFQIYERHNAKCVISVFEPKHPPGKAYKVLDDGSIVGVLSPSAPYTRRQDLPTTVQPNGAIYWFNVGAYLEHNLIPRESVFPYVMSEQSSTDIDDINDFLVAESILSTSHES
ncbi:CMP-sialic acid synthetase [Pseudoalteromonas luteoviolacea]|uniref:CMP-sialic acid synthetase n=1 Tax=Pseudoalteromonas luteoviolacea TaxID=43657 RepID=A0A1C0TND4_9GAMM|nr:acylneuraminate cytidylyltransferase family protein [Pseudoalteromonas luteoviolacea]OCQ20194.1 CMP-sialic acid synthetase [Pseudoalteromonas luteoviolacea]